MIKLFVLCFEYKLVPRNIYDVESVNLYHFPITPSDINHFYFILVVLVTYNVCCRFQKCDKASDKLLLRKFEFVVLFCRASNSFLSVHFVLD